MSSLISKPMVLVGKKVKNNNGQGAAWGQHLPKIRFCYNKNPMKNPI
jgi:hypothetical protein